MTSQDTNASAIEIARKLYNARRSASPLAAFPGDIPVDLDASYVIQDIAIGLTSASLGGWKVGRIPLDLEEGLGIDRLAGPIFKPNIRHAEHGETIDMAAYADGFMAIEAEFIAVIGQDAPQDKTTWSTQESDAMISEVCIGLEIASSPMRTINELGPLVVVADFGNNAGLIVGPAIGNWRKRPLESMPCASYIDEVKVGDGGAFNLTGGIVRSVQFLLELNARRGCPLRAGDVIATGQTSGIHDIDVGQVGRIQFGDDGVVMCRIVEARGA